MRAQFKVLLIMTALVPRIAVAHDEADESKAIKKIKLLRGEVLQDKNKPGRPIAVSFMESNRFNGKFLHVLKGAKSLTSLNLNKTQTTDDQLNVLVEFSNS
jgi:hypothetical protein